MKYDLLSEISAMRANGYDTESIRLAQECMRTFNAVYEEIERAFSGVMLGSGIGLWQAQGLDDYADDATCALYREKDEKSDLAPELRTPV